ncbi:hypothetical protein [Alysiella filiformis]|uniref:hypothetical protein n=1 Tax=Alysiella filiformis TaxID=194196 RepID=UPI001C5472B7|nr:hypothetical protein [Alysiella filiformis]
MDIVKLAMCHKLYPLSLWERVRERAKPFKFSAYPLSPALSHGERERNRGTTQFFRQPENPFPTQKPIIILNNL